MDKFLDIPAKAFGYVYKAITMFHIFIASKFYKSITHKHKCLPGSYFCYQIILLTLYVSNILINSRGTVVHLKAYTIILQMVL